MQDAEIIVSFDPGIALFAKHLARFASGRVEKIEVKLVLGAIQDRGPDEIVAHPSKTGNIDVLVIGQANPVGLSAIGIDYSQPHSGIWVADFRIFLIGNCRVLWDEIGDG